MLNGKGNGEVVAIGFTAGFAGAAAVLLAARLMFYAGIGPALGVALLSPGSRTATEHPRLRVSGSNLHFRHRRQMYEGRH